MTLTVREVARLLKISEKTVYRWIREKELPARLVSEQYHFNRAELLEWATAHRVAVAPELFQEAEDGSAPLPGLVEALTAGGIVRGLTGADRDAVLRGVVSAMPLPEGIDREFLTRILLAREALGSTGVGDGIAIPHVRNPIVLNVAYSSVTLCFLEKPIDFAAIDGRPVHTLFTLISPTTRAHLHLISRLAFALRDPGFKETVTRRGTGEEILREAKRVEGGLQ
ncbi:MAG: PTS sugar transporter subunit IIA [Planctomycetes bacterium]|nr:PTS sugar transporter subunit IIA [Planctomycetota bacterium]